MPVYTRSQAWELSLLALCAWREDRQDGYSGMLAVCWSVRNRALKLNWWGKGWAGVILKKFQYSSFNIDDPNATKFPDPIKDAASWENALQAAEDAYNATVPDPTSGATHYHVKDMKVPPTWSTAASTTFLIEIGAHRYYKAN